MLTAALKQATASLAEFAQGMAAVQVKPIQITVAGGGTDDRTEAEAIKRGQRPEFIAAVRKAL